MGSTGKRPAENPLAPVQFARRGEGIDRKRPIRHFSRPLPNGGGRENRLAGKPQAIIEEARAGNWREAEEEALALQQAQRPAGEQVERVSRYWP